MFVTNHKRLKCLSFPASCKDNILIVYIKIILFKECERQYQSKGVKDNTIQRV